MTAPAGFEAGVRITAQNLARQAIRETVAGLRELRAEQQAGAASTGRAAVNLRDLERALGANHPVVQRLRSQLQGVVQETNAAGAAAVRHTQAVVASTRATEELTSAALPRSLALMRAHVRGAITSSELAEALGRTGARGAQAARGVGTLRASLTVLAAQMVGVQGVVGRLGGSLLLFAGGNVIALGVVAGIAAIAGAWRLFTRDAREAREEAEKTLDEVLRRADQARPALERLAEQMEQIRGLAPRQSFLDALRGGLAAVPGPVGELARAGQRRSLEQDAELRTRISEGQQRTDEEIAAANRENEEKQREALAERIGLLTRAHGLGRLEVGERREAVTIEAGLQRALAVGNLTLEARLRIVEQLAALAPLTGRLTGDPGFLRTMQDARPALRGPGGITRGVSGREAFPRVSVGTPPQFEDAIAAAEAARAAGAGFAQFAQQAGPAIEIINRIRSGEEDLARARAGLQILFDAGKISAEEYRQAIEQLNKGMEDSSAQAQATAVAMVGAFSQVVASLIRGTGGIGGFLGGLLGTIGGVVSFVNPLAGAALAGGGAVIGALGSRGGGSDRVIPVSIREDRTKEQPQIIRFTQQIFSTTTGELIDQVEYELVNAQRRDHIVRFPPGAAPVTR